MRGFTILLFALESCLCCVLGQELPYEVLNHANGCWGEHDIYSKMNTNCSDSTVIAVRGVRAGAKLSSIVQCQRPVNKTDNISFLNECCKEDSITPSNDCTFAYDYPNLYDWCSGKRMCDRDRELRVSNQVIYHCPNGNYGYSDKGTNHSTYMVFDYYCIEANKIAACPSQSTRVGKVVYLWNDGYISRIARDCNCTIETQTHNSTIKIYTVHNDLKSNSNASCIDNASIIFIDRNGSKQLQITCQTKSKMTNSSSSFLWMIFNTNTFSGKTNGSFWFAFEATEETDTVTIKCFGDVGSTPNSGAPGLPLVWIIIAVIGSLIFLIILVICCMKCCSDSPAISNQIQSDDIERMSAKSPALVNPGNTKWMMAGPVVSVDDPPSATRRKKRRTKSRNLQENATPKPNGQTAGGNDENSKTKKEKRRRKTKKKHKHKEQHVYNTIVQTENRDQSDLQMGHTEGVNVGESLSLDNFYILDKSETMNRGDPVPNDSKSRHRKRKKRQREPLSMAKETEQAGDKNNRDKHGRRKKRNKHSQKEDKRQTYAGEERLPQFQEPVHKCENEVYPSNDSN